jgi:hypothetical protein
LGKTLHSPIFKDNLEKSISNPNGSEAKKTLKMIDSLLSISGEKVVGSHGERKSAIRTMMSMAQFFGSPSIFFTFAPDDIHPILTLRMSCLTRNGNVKFPAVDYGFEKKITIKAYETTNNVVDDEIDISELSLLQEIFHCRFVKDKTFLM